MNASDYIDAVNEAIDALVAKAAYGIGTVDVVGALLRLVDLRNAWDDGEVGNLG